MDVKKELEKFSNKEIVVEEILKENNLEREIKKGSLLVQYEIKELGKQINDRNQEAENLKKENFAFRKIISQKNEMLLELLENFESLIKIREKDVSIPLIFEKEEYILKKYNISLLAKENEAFNPRYHQALNSELEKKESYTIDEIVEQGYIENDKVLKIAKVIVR